jgi:transcriptional regulator with XRE-family HTH domain
MSEKRVIVHSASKLGRVVRQRRTEQKLSQQDISNVTAVNHSRISQLERGLGGLVPLRQALLVVRAVGLDIELRYREESRPLAMLSVPPNMVAHVRMGLHSVLGRAAEGISQTVLQPDREKYPEWYEEDREHFEQTCALLDLIGWGEPPHAPSTAQIPLPEHRWALTEALPVVLRLADVVMDELDLVEQQRQRRGEPPQREQTIERVQALREFAATVDEQMTALDTLEGTSK